MTNNKLYIVGTPIGNLKDITLRAIDTLKMVDIILCEDTRVSAKLLTHYEIHNKKLISYHNFNETKISAEIIKILKEEQKNIALISDAGMPRISDPGFTLLNECYANQIDVEVIPGPSAFLVSFVLSGFNSPFTFLGFLKDKSLQRQKELKSLTFGTYIIYVAPHKLMATLNDLLIVLGEKTKIFLSKEITKIYEKHFQGTIIEVLQELKENYKEKNIKGEFTLCFQYLNEELKKEKINKYQHFSKIK